MRLVLALLLTGCVPRPTSFCVPNCAANHAEWSGATMPSPNPDDEDRAPWCICETEHVMFAMPPVDPDTLP